MKTEYKDKDKKIKMLRIKKRLVTAWKTAAEEACYTWKVARDEVEELKRQLTRAKQKAEAAETRLAWVQIKLCKALLARLIERKKEALRDNEQ